MPGEGGLKINILISGATGFIGSCLIPQLLSNGHKIFGIIRIIHKDFDPRIQWIEQDLAKPFQHFRFPEELDAIIHLAQSSYYRDFPTMAEDIFNVNIRSTFDLLEYGRLVDIKKIIFASSGGVYGYSRKRFIESDPINPINFYLSSKYSAELMMANYRNFFETIVFRFFFVYGEGQKVMLFPRLLEKIKRGETITIKGERGMCINPIYVGDAIRAFEPILSSSSPSDIYNIAGDEVVSIKDLVLMMGRSIGKKVDIKYIEHSDVGDLIGENIRMKEKLGIYPKINLENGISKIVHYIE